MKKFITQKLKKMKDQNKTFSYDARVVMLDGQQAGHCGSDRIVMDLYESYLRRFIHGSISPT